MKNLTHFYRRSLKIGIQTVALFATLSSQAQTVYDIIANSADHTILETAIDAAELDDDLQGTGPFTVFAPTDDAVNALGSTLTDLVVSDPTGELAQILLYHVLGQDVVSTSLSNGLIVTPLNTANTLKITILSANGTVKINQATVTVADLDGTNGTVHVIDAVLLPDETVADIIIDSPDHTTLEAAVIAAELLPALTDPAGTYTVFAPDDDAFSALGSTVDDLLTDPAGDLRDILLYHLLVTEQASTSLSNGMMPTTYNAANTIKITVTDPDGFVFANQAEVTTADIDGGTGIVHVIDEVLLPGETVADIIIDSPNHTTLETAVIEAELLPALTDPAGTYTIFAPDDDAFSALGSTVDDLLTDPTGDLQDILLYHVLASQVGSGDIVNGDFITPLNSINTLKATVTSADGDVYINHAQVSSADIDGGNGVVHVIDAVVLPDETVADVIIDSPNHGTLEIAVIEAELLPALTNPTGMYTVFAPDDDAFSALGSTVNDLLADPTGELQEILLYHVLGSEVASTDLTNGDLATPLNNSNTLKVTITSADGDVYINQAQVTTADVDGGNGLVHILDAVVLPDETVADIIIDSDDHTTLETAVIAAELLPALTDPAGTYTVFGPTDDAFAALGSTVTDLLMDPTGDLKDILLYHVLGSEVASSGLSTGMMPTPLNTSNTLKITVTDADGDVFINQAEVSVPDVDGGNGLVHIVNEVLLPDETVADVIIDSPNHNTLENGIVLAELLPALTDPDAMLTVFAPNDDAFDALGSAGNDLFNDPTGDLKDILLYHVTDSKALSSTLSDGMMITMLSTEEVTIFINSSSDVAVNDAFVITPDIERVNGVVHVVDGVLSPLTTGLFNNDYSTSFTLYPNPSTEYITLEMEKNIYNIMITDMNGEVFDNISVRGNTINVSDLSPGTYVISFSDETTTYSKTFTVQ